MDGQNIEVLVDNDELVIAGETRRENQVERGGYRIAERQVGQFRRVIRLPFEPDPERIEAEVKNGILNLKIAQPAETDRTKRIAVKSGAADTASAGKSEDRSEAAA